MMNRVENLRKITLAIQAGTSREKMDLQSRPAEFEFVFGLGAEGMTPFEYELLDSTEGDEIALPLQKDEIDPTFEHLHPPILNLFENRTQLFLKFRILKITPADNREIVKAMAAMAGRGNGCDCGCGCP